ncbi:Fe-S cluster assembly protein SufB, partial [Candidatus Peregrinibacteria bacterium]|nr:Fe-S cluster assembly protein SufB [Candidatus Peregrinibacteria bacterium]
MNFDFSQTKYGFKTEDRPKYKSDFGLSKKIVEQISKQKNEPEWMLEKRLLALELFAEKGLPKWGADLEQIDFERIHYYLKPSDQEKRSWDDVPQEIKYTFEKLGIPEAERKYLAGVGAQFESEVV